MRQLRRWLLVFVGLVAAVWSLPVLALTQATAMPLQGVLRTTAGGPVTDGVYALTVSLYDQKDAVTPVWKQVMSGVSVQGGLFSVEIGADPLLPLPTALTGSNQPLWFGIAVGTDPELPRTSVGWVPRALWANVAGIAQSVACTGCIGADQIAANSLGADKVAFNYAGSASPGGPATSALTAALADKATQADVAGSAASATTAASAGTAASADIAKDLNCTGCVSLVELANDAASAFLPISGGTLTGTGNLKVPGTLTVNTLIDLSNAILMGGRFAAGDVCDATHSGAFSWDKNANRFSLCDGTAYRKMPFCSEQCQDPGKITCGQPVPDICGDTTGSCGASQGTYCKTAGQVCADTGTGVKCQAVAKSCLAIRQANGAATSGDYWIDPDGVGGEAPIQVYCDMTTNSAVSGTTGGWTLVMKIDGSKDTFLYDSALWTDKNTLNPGNFTFADQAEFKSSAFWTLPFNSVRVLMAPASGGAVNAGGAVELQADGHSLWDIFVSGVYRPTYIGKGTWKGLLSGMTLLANCNLEGFNVRAQDPLASTKDRPRVRIGILTNNETDCGTVDAWIGVGEQGSGCNGQAIQHATGNSCAGCGCDNGGSNLVASYTYIFIR